MEYKPIKIIITLASLICNFLFFHTIKAYSSSACAKSFKDTEIHTHAGIDIKKYSGLRGYMRFTTEYFNGRMGFAFKAASVLLSTADFKKLNWNYFSGTVSEAKNLIKAITKPTGQIREEYMGIQGYVRWADEYFDGNMNTAFLKLSAVSNHKRGFHKLEWKKFIGTTKEFKALPKKILDEQGNIRPEYIGIKGLMRFANKHYKENIHKAFTNISVILSTEQFQLLQWKLFYTSSQELKNISDNLLDEQGNVQPEYIKIEGYILLADQFFNGDMHRTIHTIYALLNREQIKQLKWKRFLGTTQEIKNLANIILDKNGNIKTEYKHINGLAQLAYEHFDGNITLAYKKSTYILNKTQKRQSRWKVYQGSTTDFQHTRERLFDDEGFLREEYTDIPGQMRYADHYYKGSLKRTFNNVHIVLNHTEFHSLGWVFIRHNTKSLIKWAHSLLDNTGNIKEIYTGEEGQKQFADEYLTGHMEQAFIIVFAILGEQVINNLGWKGSYIPLTKVREIRMTTTNSSRSIHKRYLGMNGLMHLADQFFNGDMILAYTAAIKIWNRKTLKQKLKWGEFTGTTQDFRNLKRALLDETENIKDIYQYANGQIRLADEFFNGDMLLTYKIISLTLSTEQFKKLSWKRFNGGSTTDFIQRQKTILDEQGNIRPEYIGIEGYIYFADKYTNGNMRKAFLYCSEVLNTEQLRDLGWKRFPGSTQQFKDIISLVLNSDGSVNSEYIGITGNKIVTDILFDNNVTLAYEKVSKALDNKIFRQLEWKKSATATQGVIDLPKAVLNGHSN